ncbi:hypothetical protein ACRRTK_023452 [Alexandromys fortis]
MATFATGQCYGTPATETGHSSTSHTPDATTSQLFCFYPSLCLQPLTNTWCAQVKPQTGPPPAAVTSSGLTPVPVSLKTVLPRVPGDCPAEQP